MKCNGIEDVCNVLILLGEDNVLEIGIYWFIL